MQDYFDKIVFESMQMSSCAFPLKCFEEDEQGRYWISLNGNVISVCKDQASLLKFTDNGKGYLQIKIDGKTYYLHRLLAFAFNEVKEKKDISINDQSFVVHHIDFDKTNNELSNLCIMPKAKHDTIHRLYKKWQQMELEE